METVQTKAQRLLDNGCILELKPATVWEVRGDTGSYIVDCLNGNTDDALRCNCIRGIHRESARYCHMAVGEWCSHIRAVCLLARQMLEAAQPSHRVNESAAEVVRRNAETHEIIARVASGRRRLVITEETADELPAMLIRESRRQTLVIHEPEED